MRYRANPARARSHIAGSALRESKPTHPKAHPKAKRAVFARAPLAPLSARSSCPPECVGCRRWGRGHPLPYSSTRAPSRYLLFDITSCYRASALTTLCQIPRGGRGYSCPACWFIGVLCGAVCACALPRWRAKWRAVGRASRTPPRLFSILNCSEPPPLRQPRAGALALRPPALFPSLGRMAKMRPRGAVLRGRLGAGLAPCPPCGV